MPHPQHLGAESCNLNHVKQHAAAPVRMPTEPVFSKSEEKLLSCLGYLVVRWNYLEHCTRQILRMYAQGDSIDDPDHLRISAHVAIRIEQELKKIAADHWTGDGKRYLDCLIAAYEIAREHRNHFVHGMYMTFGARGPCSHGKSWSDSTL